MLSKIRADWAFVILIAGCLVAACFIGSDHIPSIAIAEERENPVSPRAIIQEQFTPKDMAAVYKQVNADLRRFMDRKRRSSLIELESLCSFNSAAVERILIDYRAVGWVIEKAYTSDSAGDVYVFKLPVRP